LLRFTAETPRPQSTAFQGPRSPATATARHSIHEATRRTPPHWGRLPAKATARHSPRIVTDNHGGHICWGPLPRPAPATAPHPRSHTKNVSPAPWLPRSLACISHRLSAASSDTSAPAALRSVGLLNTSTPLSINSSPWIRLRWPRSQALQPPPSPPLRPSTGLRTGDDSR
jgi:hypothetical protein